MLPISLFLSPRLIISSKHNALGRKCECCVQSSFLTDPSPIHTTTTLLLSLMTNSNCCRERDSPETMAGLDDIGCWLLLTLPPGNGIVNAAHTLLPMGLGRAKRMFQTESQGAKSLLLLGLMGCIFYTQEILRVFCGVNPLFLAAQQIYSPSNPTATPLPKKKKKEVRRLSCWASRLTPNPPWSWSTMSTATTDLTLNLCLAPPQSL